MASQVTAGTGGERYIPYAQRTGNESIVYFTRDLSPEGLMKVYERVNGAITGKVAIKLHKMGFRSAVFATLEKVVLRLCETICDLTPGTI